MKKLLIVFLSALLLLTSCSSNASEETADVTENGTERKSSIVLSGTSSYLEYVKISRLSGYDCKIKEFMPDQVTLKLLAGDSDVDIYFLYAETVQQLQKQGLLCPINSEAIKSFNDSCFDHIRKFTVSQDGDTVAMVVNACVRAFVYPSELEAETGVDIQALTTLDDYLEFISSYNGERVGYINDDECMFYELNVQYENQYCDLSKGMLNYHTDTYKNMLISTLTKRDENGSSESFYGLKNVGLGGIKDVDFDTSTLFLADACYYDLMYNASDYASELRAIPLPKINENSKNTLTVLYAVINPYSKNKEGATKVLETISENLDKVAYYYGSYPFIKKEKADYPETYLTDTKLFEDYYNIVANAFIADYWIGTTEYLGFVDKYRSGEITAEKAIDEYERMVDIWINE